MDQQATHPVSVCETKVGHMGSYEDRGPAAVTRQHVPLERDGGEPCNAEQQPCALPTYLRFVLGSLCMLAARVHAVWAVWLRVPPRCLAVLALGSWSSWRGCFMLQKDEILRERQQRTGIGGHQAVLPCVVAMPEMRCIRSSPIPCPASDTVHCQRMQDGHLQEATDHLRAHHASTMPALKRSHAAPQQLIPRPCPAR